MTTMFAAAVVALAMTSVAPLTIAPAEAATVTTRVVRHHGPFGHGCRKVVKTVRAHGRVVRREVRRVCR